MQSSLAATPRTLALQSPPQGDAVDVDEEADGLLKKHTVFEIRSLEKRTRYYVCLRLQSNATLSADIERKKQELRLTVGERYRDLIQAADSITDMKTSIATVHSVLQDVRASCSMEQVRKPVSSSGASSTPTTTTMSAVESMTGVPKHQAHMFRVAGQIKLLVDTPEQIWHCLEGKRYLTASMLFLVARQVYNNLSRTDDQSDFNVMKRFPVVVRQWEAVSHFRNEIISGSKQFLHNANLSAQEVAETIAVIVLIERLSSAAALDEFLRARLAAAKAVIDTSKAEAADPSSDDAIVAKRTFVKLIDTVQLTLTDIKSVFIGEGSTAGGETDPTGAQSLLAQCLHSLSSGRGGAVPSISPSSSSNLTQSPNAPPEAASSFISNLYSTKTNIHLLSRYLPASVQRYTPFLGTSNLGVALSVVQKQTNALFLDELRAFLRDSPQAKQLFARLNSGRAYSIVHGSVLDRLQGIEVASAEEGEHIEWPATCTQVLGKKLSIWHDILRPSFQTQAFALISNTFASFVRQPETLLPPLLQKAAQEPRVGNVIWNGGGDSSVSSRASGLLPSSQVVVQGFESALSAVEADLKPIFVISPKWDVSFDVQSDQQKIQEQLKSACIAAVKSYQSALDGLIKSHHVVVSSSYDDVVPVNLHALLLLARICRALSQSSTSLTRLINSSSLSTVAVPSSRKYSPKFDQLSASPVADVVQLQGRFQDLSVQAHADWIQWIVSQSTQEVAAYIRQENWSLALFQTLSWQASGLDGGDTNPDDLVRLPVQPSVPLFKALFKLCDHLQNIASFTIEKRVVTNLLLELSRNLLPIYEQVVRGPNDLIGDKGALQLLFDVRLLLLIVRPSWEGSELENLLEKQGQTIVRALQDRVDPIDLAVSEPPLNQNIDRYYQRSYVLLGLLLPLHSRPQENRKLRGSDQPNILAMSSKTKRFIHLPISEGTPFSTPAVAQARISALVDSIGAPPGVASSPSRHQETRRLAKPSVPIKISAANRSAAKTTKAAKASTALVSAAHADSPQQSGFFGFSIF